MNTEDTQPSEQGPYVISDGMNSMVRLCEIVLDGMSNNVKVSAHKAGFEPHIFEYQDLCILGRVIGKAVLTVSHDDDDVG